VFCEPVVVLGVHDGELAPGQGDVAHASFGGLAPGSGSSARARGWQLRQVLGGITSRILPGESGWLTQSNWPGQRFVSQPAWTQ